SPVVKLDQQRSCPQVKVLGIVIEILILRSDPFFYVGLIVTMETQTVIEHLESDDQVRAVRRLPVTKEFHARDDGLFNCLIGHRRIGRCGRTHDIECPVFLEISLIAVVVFDREFLVSEARGKEDSERRQVNSIHKTNQLKCGQSVLQVEYISKSIPYQLKLIIVSQKLRIALVSSFLHLRTPGPTGKSRHPAAPRDSIPNSTETTIVPGVA